MRILQGLTPLLLLVMTGCPPQYRGHGAPKMEPPPRPPSYPATRPVALNPELLASARREIADALRSSDEVMRVHALEAIRQTMGREHSAEILRALSDPQAVVRFAACLAAGEMKLVDARPQLLTMVDDPSENVRVGVRFALHRLGDISHSHQLERMALDAHVRVRANTAMVLGLLGEPSAVMVLRPMRLDREAPVRQQAAEALWRLKDELGLEDLIGLTLSKYGDDQVFAILALAGPRDTRVRQHIRGKLTDGQFLNGKQTDGWLEVALAAARAMGMLGSDEGYGVALLGARSQVGRGDQDAKSAEQAAGRRALAAFAFGAIGRSDAQDVLATLLKDDDRNVRIAAATAILELKPPGK